MKDKLLLYGAGGHGKVCADIARLNGYKEIVFYDDDINKKFCGAYNVIHNFDSINKNDYDIFISIGDNKTREMVAKQLDTQLTTLIHPTSVIGENVLIEDGVVVMANVVINPSSIIRRGVIINTCASIDHDNVLGDFCHVSINSHLAGRVVIGKRVFVGMNATIINSIKICDDVILGASSTVLKNIEEKGTYAGTPVTRIK